MTERDEEDTASREPAPREEPEPGPASSLNKSSTEIPEEIPEEITEQIRRALGDSYGGNPEAIVQISRFVASYYSGHLPPPPMLQGYEDVGEGFADRIVTLMEEQSAHRRAIEKTTIDSDVQSRDRGQIMAFVLCLAVLIGGFAAILTGHSLEGMSAIIIAVGGVAVTFLATRRRQDRELEQKREVFPEDDE